MKKKQFLLGGLMSLMSLGIISCSKEQGCTEFDAVNYNSLADENDGSCEFEGSLVVYYESPTAQAFANIGVSTLNFYIDGNLIGSQAANLGWNAAPSCGQALSISADINLGTSRESEHFIRVVDEDGDDAWRGTIDLTANYCTKVKLDASNAYPDFN